MTRAGQLRNIHETWLLFFIFLIFQVTVRGFGVLRSSLVNGNRFPFLCSMNPLVLSEIRQSSVISY